MPPGTFAPHRFPAAGARLGFNFVVLDQPALILPSQGVNLAQAMIAPQASFARFDGEWATPFPANGPDGVTFVFAWRNPRDRVALINVETYLRLAGMATVYAAPGFNYTALGVYVYLGLFEWWNNPPTQPMVQLSQITNVAGPTASGGGLFGLGELVRAPLGGDFDVGYRMLAVPAGGVVVFTVALVVNHWTNGGDVQVDFDTDAFRVICPMLVIAILD